MTISFEEIRFSLPHVELAARVFGPEDGLPVLALHGWMDNAMTFERLAPKLKGVRIVALDFAGHGYSGHYGPGSSYSMWEFVEDVLLVSEQLGWERFALLGHSLGAIVSVIFAAAMPERVSRLALIDGLLPHTYEAEGAAERLGDALKARLALRHKSKSVYAEIERAVQARMKGFVPVSHEAAELLARRGLQPVAGGYTWRTDPRLTLPSMMRMTRAHAEQFVASLRCPVNLILAEGGHVDLDPRIQPLLVDERFQVARILGGHHLHLNDEAGARQVADCFNPFLVLA